MTEPSTYKEVPVSAAVEISERFEKHVVVILSVDHKHDMTHFTSYGRNPEDKILAAYMTDAVAQFLTGKAFDSRIPFGDWRTVNAAERAHQVDQLKRACRAADHALGWIMAIRDGRADEALQNSREELQSARDALRSALNEGPSAQGPTP